MGNTRGFRAGLICAAPLLLLLPFPDRAMAQRGRVSCLAGNKGPCQTADAFDYLVGSSDLGLVLTNFGLLFPGMRDGEWQIVCDDNFGVAPVDQIRRAPGGEVFAASNEGLYFSISSDGCEWAQATGDIAGSIVFDVAFDPKDRDVVWALGELPRVLWRSSDGGRSFSKVHAFDQSLAFRRLRIAPSDGRVIHVFGWGRGAATPYAWSNDGGQTFTIGDVLAGAASPPRAPFEFAAFAPDDPQTIYFVVLDPAGDQIWRTTDGGRTTSMLFKLTGEDAFGGLAFGESSQTLYVAGTNTFPQVGSPRGRLYISRDGGKSWLDPIPADDNGPAYRCLISSGGKLYSCGNGAMDNFLVGVSSDEGKTWSPVARLNQVMGAKSCIRSRCVTTETWLCDSYAQCPPGVEPTRSPPVSSGIDAAPDASATGDCPGGVCGKAGGCSCEAGGRPGQAWPALLLLALLISRLQARKARHLVEP